MDPKEMPVVAVEFRLADGEVLYETWSLSDGDETLRRVMDAVTEIPDWLDNPLKSWPRPQDPITFSGDVQAGRESEAREFVAALVSSPKGGQEK